MPCRFFHTQGGKDFGELYQAFFAENLLRLKPSNFESAHMKPENFEGMNFTSKAWAQENIRRQTEHGIWVSER